MNHIKNIICSAHNKIPITKCNNIRVLETTLNINRYSCRNIVSNIHNQDCQNSDFKSDRNDIHSKIYHNNVVNENHQADQDLDISKTIIENNKFNGNYLVLSHYLYFIYLSYIILTLI